MVDVQHTADGRMALREFVRLAGLAAAGAVSAVELAAEFSRHAIVLDLTTTEAQSGVNLAWRQLSLNCRDRCRAAQALPPGDHRVTVGTEAIAGYRDLLTGAAYWLDATARAADVPRKQAARPPGTRHLHLVR